MNRKNELCTIDVRIKGKIVNKKSEEVIHYHHLSKIPFAVFLAKIGSEAGNFQTTVLGWQWMTQKTLIFSNKYKQSSFIIFLLIVVNI